MGGGKEMNSFSLFYVFFVDRCIYTYIGSMSVQEMRRCEGTPSQQQQQQQ